MKKKILTFALLIVIFLCAGFGLERISPAGAAAASAQEAELPLPEEHIAPAPEARTLSLAEAPLPAQAAVVAVFLLFGLIALFPLFVDRREARGDQVGLS